MAIFARVDRRGFAVLRCTASMHGICHTLHGNVSDRSATQNRFCMLLPWPCSSSPWIVQLGMPR